MSAYSSPLKRAFARARATGNIEDILPELLRAQLFVVCKRVPAGASPAFFIQHSPKPERWCVTVADSTEALRGLQDVDLVPCVGEALIAAMNRAHEIVVAYPDGGDYLTREQLDYFRSLSQPG